MVKHRAPNEQSPGPSLNGQAPIFLLLPTVFDLLRFVNPLKLTLLL